MAHPATIRDSWQVAPNALNRFPRDTLYQLLGNDDAALECARAEAERARLFEIAEDALALAEQNAARRCVNKVRKCRGKRPANGPTEKEQIIISYLTEHHRYENGSCLHLEPVGVRELQRKIGKESMSEGTVSNFFTNKFGGHKKYKNFYCRNASALAQSLRMLNNELTPQILYNRLTHEPAAHADRRMT